MTSPLPDWGVIGNEAVQARLARTLERGQLGHAYLFTGPNRVGRRTLALAVSRAVNCLETARKPYDFCHRCASCRLPATGHPDVNVLSPGDTGRIGIDAAREVRHVASLTPGLGRRRFVIIDEVHRLTSDAADALLKTLEEPASHTTFVFVAPHAAAVSETIASRCQEVRLVPVAPERIAHFLAGMGYEPGKAAEIAELSFGRPGWAIQAAQDPGLLEGRRTTLATWERLGAGRVADRLMAAADLARFYADEGRAALLEDLQLFISWRRAQLASVPQYPSDIGTWRAALSALCTLQRRLTFNVNVRLALEAAALELP